MRRQIERKVTVELSEKEVRGAILGMARCPQRFRGSATFKLEEGVYTVQWRECSGPDKTQPDADPKRSAARRKRNSNIVDLAGQTFGQWEVLGLADARAYPAGGRQTMWNCKCGSCGETHAVNGAALRRGATSRCKACAQAPVPDAQRICKWCEVKLSPKSAHPTRCPRCMRQVERMKKRVTDGLCPCGEFPYYPSKPCPKCDRKPEERKRANQSRVNP